ncbi:MAG: tetratricopeptide repeat protein, partial [Deltaproteobacteria bacterium]
MAVAPPRFENGIAGLGAGYADWVRSALAAVGVEVVSREATRAAAGSVVPGREDVAGLGADLDAGFVLLTEATAVAGRFEIQVRLYETATNQLVGFARTEEAVQALGTSAREVTASIVEQAGLRAEAVRDAPAPRLIDLAAASRALAALDRGDLGRAWREVDGRLSPTADRIRERIEAASGGEGVTTAVRARLWIAQGQPDRAAQLVRPELRSSRDPEVFIAAADAAVALRDPRRAVELYERAIELGGDRADAYLGLGRALSVGKRYEQARAAVERAAELDPADPEPLEALVELWSDDPARAARYHLLAGQRAAARFESKRAERSFERAEQLAPRDTGRAPARMASFQRDLGNPRPAIRAYERAIERGNADADTWRGLADARRA